MNAAYGEEYESYNLTYMIAMDTNLDGYVSFAEYNAYWSFFAGVDTNADGYWSLEEVDAYYTEYDNNEYYFNLMDSNGDGLISYAEY